MHSRAEKSGQAQPVRQESGGRPASSGAPGSSGRGFVGERKISSNQQSHPNMALSKPVHCSTYSTVAWGAQMGS